MTLQKRRVVTFVISNAIIILSMYHFGTTDFRWYDVFDYVVLAPSIAAALLLIRVWIKEYIHHKKTNAYNHRLYVGGGYVMPSNK